MDGSLTQHASVVSELGICVFVRDGSGGVVLYVKVAGQMTGVMSIGIGTVGKRK